MVGAADGRHDIPRLERLPSGIPGLDAILRGGFFRGGVYIVDGEPGTGKTILGNQLCFGQAQRGGKALYVTLLAESHDRMLSYLRDLAFFDAAAVSRGVFYLSGLATLEGSGLSGLLTLARREVLARGASILVLDGLVQAAAAAASDTELKKFIGGLQTHASTIGCTVFLLTSEGKRPSVAERTMVDGTIELADAYQGWVARRDLTVAKFRGGSFMRGKHAFRITDEGIKVYPRLESAYRLPARRAPGPRRRLPIGTPGIDAMLDGGLAEGSCTLVLGPSGSGKTNLALHALAQASVEEPAAMLGFYEAPGELLERGEAFHPGFRGLAAAGALHLLWDPGTERLLDEVGHELLALVRERGAKRLVVDGLAAFERLAAPSERMPRFFAALTNELRALGVTSIFTREVPELVGPVLRAPSTELTLFADNLILLRFAEEGGRLVRSVSIMKVRDGGFDAAARAFEVRAGGLRLLEALHQPTPGPPRRNLGPEDGAP